MAKQLALSRPSHRVNTRGLSDRQRDLAHSLLMLDRWSDLALIRRCQMTPAYDDLREALDALVERGLLSRRERKGPGRGRYQYRIVRVSERINQ